jgi:hypothetical protein
MSKMSEMPTREQRIANFFRNLDEAIRMDGPDSPSLPLLLHVRELAEIVKLREENKE